MTDTPNFQALHYLPVEVYGQTFAIPMSEVVAIHRSGGGAVDESVVPKVSEPSGASVMTIDLRHLFWGEAVSSPHAHVVVISTHAGTCALLVDAVRPSRTAEATAQSPLPRLVAAMDLPFSGVLREPDVLVLIMDSQRLVEQLRQIAPELIVESVYAT
jgi:chemotaxis signal transduction protein